VRSFRSICFAPPGWHLPLHIARSGSAFLGGLTVAFGRVTTPTARRLSADISGQAPSRDGFRATASSHRRRRSTRASWLACICAANYGHVSKGIYSPVP
jgi:hypothetical protein